MHFKISVQATTSNPPGFQAAVLTSAGTAISSLRNYDVDGQEYETTSTQLNVLTPFASDYSVALTSGENHGWLEEVWNTANFSDGSVPDPAAVVELVGPDITPGSSYRLLLAGTWDADRDVEYTVNGVSAVYDNQTQSGRPYAPEPQAEIIAVAADDGSGNGVLTITSDYAAGSERNYLAGIEVFDSAASSTPTITDINTNNEVVPGTTATLTGTNLTGSTGFNIGSESQTDFTVVSDTSVTFTTVRGGNPYNQNLTGTLLHPDGNQTITVQQVPESGTFAVTAASPNTTDDASLWTGLIDTATSDPITIVDGDQAWVKNPNSLTNLAIAPDGTITADETGDFVVQIWLASEGVWGSDQSVSFTLPDEVGPAVSTVNVPTAGSYGIGDAISFTVNFDEAATVTGTPRLPVNLATGTVYADYASGSGTTAIVFSATVQEGDNDADGITLSDIELNGGTIQDGSSNNASLTLAGVESTAGVLVDGVRPVITVSGTNPYNMTVGETYVEQGATASDNQDGSLGSVTGTGSVDGGTEGQYTITYPGAGVVDSAGNVALDVTRIVNVSSAGSGTVTIGTSLRSRRIGNRKAVRSAANASAYQAIYRS